MFVPRNEVQTFRLECNNFGILLFLINGYFPPNGQFNKQGLVQIPPRSPILLGFVDMMLHQQWYLVLICALLMIA